MPDLSVLIPARNEEWLARTVADVLAHAECDTQVIALVDGEAAGEPLTPHPRLRVVVLPGSIGQRAATNHAARLSEARYIMKLDAHCSLEQGFDRKLLTAVEGRDDWTILPVQRNLHVFDWRCLACGERTYMGPSLAKCGKCGHTEHERVMVWQPRGGSSKHLFRFDHEMHFQYQDGWQPRHIESDGVVADTMSLIGACWMMGRERFWQLGGLDEAHGSWGQMGTEIACKTWLSGGRLVSCLTTWYAHMFRTRADFSFPYQIHASDQDKARAYSRAMWLNDAWPGQVMPLAWLVNKFKPLPGWHEAVGAEALRHIRESERVFLVKHPKAERVNVYA